MNETAFVETLVNTLRFDSKYKSLKPVLLPIISRSTVNSLPQWAYAARSGQHWENIELRVPVPLIDTANENEKEIKEIFSYVYEETDDYALDQVLIKPRIISSDIDELVQNEVIFDEIQDTIVQGIRDAKYLIWVAVAWFTNDTFYRELMAKREAGVNVRVIVSDEESNKVLLPRLKSSFDTVVVPRSGYYGNNRMHDKFCIIDMDYVMHGSYNWTASANYNGETWATAIDREFVKKFADEFMHLYIENHQ